MTDWGYCNTRLTDHLTTKKGYGCRWTWKTIKHYTWTQIQVHKQCLDVIENPRDNQEWEIKIHGQYLAQRGGFDFLNSDCQQFCRHQENEQ